eukprot:TRINITY_DN9478_c1_g1_i1.p1 TRINITY_DN9478_c1_g1~~TRINITY_DN9478_c1_g1_i1.p1  ORF type:complete len:339 (+),score=69.73 TRINITY_DN9478_c1_g1_i1:183-1199(+)
MPLLYNIQTPNEFQKTVAGFPAVVAQFCAEWNSDEKIEDVFDDMIQLYSEVVFMKVDAGLMEDVIVRFEVPSVPCFLLFKNGRMIKRVLGANALDLRDSLAGHFEKFQNGAIVPAGQWDDGKVKLTDKIQKKIIAYLANNPIMLFMKGNPNNPKTSFDRRLVNVLKIDEIEFSSYDILLDEEFGEGLKEYSHYPVFPQLWIDKELVGGCDVVIEMRENGELKKILEEYKKKLAYHPKNRLNSLLQQKKVVLFTKMDNSSSGIAVGQVVNALEEEEIEFESFDLSGDWDLQKEVKKVSSWPVFPQLFVRGQFVGGKDVLLDMKNSRELGETVNQVLSQQ